MITNTWLGSLALILTVLCLRRFISTSNKGLPLPPGPKTTWFGTVKLPQTFQWLTYAQWKQVYGDVIYVYVFGNPILVLNTASAASDLLDKRSGNYSSRPVRTMTVDLMGWDWLFSSMPYGPRWKRHRTLFHQHFHPQVTSVYRPIQITEANTMLRNLLSSPENFRYHIRRAAAAIVLNIAYGHQVSEEGDEYVSIADRALLGLGQAGIFGAYLVDYLPLLKYMPSWMPGAAFKREAREWRKSTRKMVNLPYEMVKERMAEGTATPCFVTQELNMNNHEDDETIKNVAATTYAAGADTVVSTILSFLLAMAIHPDIQEKAQSELDNVIGPRLPYFTDDEQLPFIDCICYELLRWNPVTPLAVPHYVSEDDEYKGYRIPKGTVVLPNVWAILHDPSVYPDPLAFKPERFSDHETNTLAGINDIPDAAFGFGRRMCPGRWLAFQSIRIAVASILSVYNISKAIDENGQPIEPRVEYTPMLLSHPIPFKCRIIPRSEHAAAIIRQTANEQL